MTPSSAELGPHPANSGPFSLGVTVTNDNPSFVWPQSLAYQFGCSGSGVTIDNVQPGAFSLSYQESIEVTITYRTGAGSGLIHCDVSATNPPTGDAAGGDYNVTVDGTSPTITLIAPVGDVGIEYPTIQIGWCDNTGLNSGSRSIAVNGVTKTSSFDYVVGGPASCVAQATSTTSSVPLNPGNNNIAASICDDVANCTTTVFSIKRLTYGVAVTPDGTSASTRPANTPGHSQAFTVQNTGNGPNTYNLTCSGSSNVSCTSLSQTSVPLDSGASASITAFYSVGAEGWGTLSLSAAGTNATDGGSWSIPVERYSVAVTPDGTATPIRPTSTWWSETFTVQNTGTAVTGSMSDSYTFTCGATAQLTCGSVSPESATIAAGNQTPVTVNYFTTTTTGTGSLTLTANGVGSDPGFYSVRVERYGVAVRPDGQAVAPLPQTSASQKFAVENTGSIAATYNLTVACTGAASACAAPPSITVQPTTVDSATVTYQTGSAGTTGRVRLLAVQSGAPAVTDSGWVDVSVGGAAAPIVDIASVNPGMFVDRGLCLAIAAGADAASECGDLRLVHALPTTRTLNKPRTPTLLYNSAFAHPYPLVAANVTLPGNGAVPDSVVATLRFGTVFKARGKWAGSSWAPDTTRRVVVGYDGLAEATGLYAYSLEVVNHYPAGVTRITTATGELAVVNRKDSPFGAGWWLAGLEEFRWLAGGRVLVIGGDGTIRVYSSAGTNLYITPNPTRPDTLDGTGTDYIRIVPHGVRVHFSATTSKHTMTVNRLGHRTEFLYDNCGRLSTIVLPPTNSFRFYNFTYSSTSDCTTRLVTVTAPLVDGQNRVTTLTVTAGRVTAIQDPDLHSVAFGYDAAFANRINTRTDRRGNTTFYAFDAGAKVAMDSLPLGTGQSPIVQRFRPFESLGLGAAIDTAVAYARLDGSRVEVADTTAFWLDRFGSPRRIVNALGHSTVIERGDARWPALATRVREPNGRALGAAYDTRGNVIEMTDSSHSEIRFVVPPCQQTPCGPGSFIPVFATTRYAWDPLWDFVTKIRRPEKDSVVMAYDPANGNRLWQQLGSDPARRITFGYGNAFGLLSSTVLPGTPSDSIEYDPTLGNLVATRTPRQFWTSFYKDALGRDTLVVSPVDSADRDRAAPHTGRLRQRTRYDLADQDTLAQTIGPAIAGVAEQTVTIRKTFDSTGNLRALSRQSTPDTAAIGTITTQWRYDRANRRVAEVSPDGQKDSTVYDPAGNAVVTVTRRKHPISGVRLGITMRYDALNRVIERVSDSLSYPRDSVGIATFASRTELNRGYPYHPNNAQGGYTVFADTARFAYDIVGNDSVADNRDALVRRWYFPNGLLQAETLYVRTLAELGAGGDFNQHRYGVNHRYDLDGRRTVLKYPAQLSPASKDSASFSYDGTTGALSEVVDPLGNHFIYHYNLRGEMDTLRYGAAPGAVFEARTYDDDGALVRHVVSGDRRDAAFKYDARQKVLWSANTFLSRDTLEARYSGLGHLVSSRLTAWGANNKGEDVATVTQDTLSHDALGNLIQARFDRSEKHGNDPPSNQRGRNRLNLYQPGTARLVRALVYTNDARDTTVFDSAGSVKGTWQAAVLGGVSSMEDRLTYYAADGTVRAADYRRTSGWPTGPNRFVFEEYRYDAYGRRVWVRARQECDGISENEPRDRGECRFDLVRRTVWDGFQELVEIQQPGGDSDPVENDTTPLRRGAPDGLDQNPLIGRVLYTYGTVLDQPLSLIRVGYADSIASTGSPQPWVMWEPFSLLPLWNYLGEVDRGMFGAGALPCRDVNGVQRCVLGAWPFGWSALGAPEFIPYFWHGTVTENKRDRAQTLYKRYRVYDPVTGRFTQEDPIGLAGGLNLYGFASGDPITFSDPFGLCPPKDNNLADCPAGGGQVKFFGIAGNLIVGTGYTGAVGRLCNDIGCAWYARLGIGAGLDVNIGTEGGSSDSVAAFSGEGEAICGGASIVNICQGNNANGSTTSAGGQIGPTEVKASGHTEKTQTWVSTIKPWSKGRNYLDCSQPQPQASVCNR